MDRYILTQLNGRFVVTDSASSLLKIVNADGQAANVRNATEVQYFDLTLEDAKILAAKLNR